MGFKVATVLRRKDSYEINEDAVLKSLLSEEKELDLICIEEIVEKTSSRFDSFLYLCNLKFSKRLYI